MLNGGQPVVFLDLVIFFCLPCLFFKGFHVLPDFEQHIFQTGQIAFGILQFPEGFLLPDLKFRYSSRFFKQCPPTVFPVRQNIVHHFQFDDGIAVGSNTGIQEKACDVFEAAGNAIEKIFAVAIPVVAAGDGNRCIIGWENVFRVQKCEAHFCHLQRFSRPGAVENEVFHFVGAEVPGFLFTQNPADGVDNIGFSATIRTDNAGHTFIKMNGNLITKAFEAFDFQFT